jgi:hypothetical protein
MAASTAPSNNGSQLPASRLRDTCRRPDPIYTQKYNPNQEPLANLPLTYSLYENGEPLHNDRPIIIIRILSGYVLAGIPGRPRT